MVGERAAATWSGPGQGEQLWFLFELERICRAHGQVNVGPPLEEAQR
jgi:hypothetical protein